VVGCKRNEIRDVIGKQKIEKRDEGPEADHDEEREARHDPRPLPVVLVAGQRRGRRRIGAAGDLDGDGRVGHQVEIPLRVVGGAVVRGDEKNQK